MLKIIVAAALVGSPIAAHAVTCTTFGNFTNCSDGSSASTFGNTTTFTPAPAPPAYYQPPTYTPGYTPMPIYQPPAYRPPVTCSRIGNTVTCN